MKNIAKSGAQKCYFYTRVSTEMQVDGYSLDAQKEVLEKEAKHRGFECVGIYPDEGKSGKNIQGREHFRQMLNDIKNNKDGVSYVFVFKLSRFGRNAADVLNSVQLMQDYGVNLLCVADGIDSASASGKLMISVLSAVAEIERENISEQTMAGRRQKAKEGKWNGGFAPYGYKLEDGKLLINEEEAEVIRAIYNKFAEGNIGLGGVAKWLTEKGYTKQIRQNGTVSSFSSSFVKGVLDNPVYMGKIAYGRRKNEKIDGTRNEYHVVKQVGFDTYYDGIHEGIVSEELWYKVQEKRKITGKKNDKIYSLEHEHILSSILKCPICGSPMYGNVSRKKKAKPGPNGEVEWYKDQFTYACKRRKGVTGVNCSFRRQPSQDKINAEVLAIVNEFFMRDIEENPEAFLMSADKLAHKQTDTDDNSELIEKQKDLERLKKQYDQKAAAKDKFFERMQSLDVSDLSYDRKFDDLQALQDKLYDEMLGIEKQINEIEAVLNASNEEKENFALVRDNILRIMDEGIDYWSDYDKKVFLQSFIESVDIFEDDKEHGRWVKHIKFKIPYAFDVDGNDVYDYDMENWCQSEATVETVCLLSKLHEAKHHVSVKLDMDEMDLTSAESKATYEEIKAYVLENSGLQVSSLYIAQVKREYGIIERENYKDSKQPQCPDEKKKAIKEALIHFGMI